MRRGLSSPRPPRRHTALTAILGLYLGKFKSDTCVYNPKTTEACFATIPSDPADLGRSLERERPALFVFEARMVAGCDACDELRLHSPVADPMQEA